MKRSNWLAAAGLALWVAGGVPVLAQRDPHLGYAFPAGGSQGSRFQVVVGGQFLDGVTNVLVSGRGVRATVSGYVRPLNPKELNEARVRLDELQKERAAARQKPAETNAVPPSGNPPAIRGLAEIDRELVELRRKVQRSRRPANPQIAETATLQFDVSTEAETGDRELRLFTAGGVSNPLMFRVGKLVERVEQEPNDQTPDAESAAAMPVVINGQILPGDVDRFRFQAREGEEWVAVASARDLIPYLADAVPGWFQAMLVLRDDAGKELAVAEDRTFQADPALHFICPQDGTYMLEIRDSLFRGREDFVYRVALGRLPFVTGHFPLGGRKGDSGLVELSGWNLRQTTVKPPTLVLEAGIIPLKWANEEPPLNMVPFAVDTLPECREQPSNDTVPEAQSVTQPLIVNGRIDPPADRDVFRIVGRAGEVLVAEVVARRLGSPLDSVLRLTDAAGRQLAANDDHVDKGAGLATHHADSWLSVPLPADGSYYLQLADAQNKGGPAHAYRLRISPPRPDFELRVVPSAVNLRFGNTVPITIYALRRDGFAGEIALALSQAPAGCELSGARVPPGQDQVRLTLSVPPALGAQPVRLQLDGRAVVNGRELRRPVVPADDVMQAFLYRHLVPAKEMMVVAARGIRPGVAFRKLSDGTVKLPSGGSAVVPMASPRRLPREQLEFALLDPPDGISLGDIKPVDGGWAIELHAEASKARPGLQGNLILTVRFSRPPSEKSGSRGVNPARGAVATLPAIPFEIVAK